MFIPNNDFGYKIKSLQALTSMLLRGTRGNMGTPTPMQPEKSLILYEHEACPYARRVREVMTQLNLDFESRPCPRKGHVYRDELKQLTGKTQVPFLIDENIAAEADSQILDSQAIIEHLFAHYSKEGTVPSQYQKKSDEDHASLANKVASVISMMRGGTADHPKMNEARGKPEQPLHLYGFEASPFCRLVRERLSELEVGYINHSVAREQIQDMGAFGFRLNIGEYQPIKGGKRERLMNGVLKDKFQFPFLIDPNTNTQLYESKAIIAYLNQIYG